MSITITEALAEIKTIGKRIEKKREFIGQYLGRQDGLRDPLEKQGGSFEAIRAERQSISDLSDRIVELRRGIAKANDHTVLTVNGITKSVSEWLVWRREIAPGHVAFLGRLRAGLSQIRTQAARNNAAVVQANASTGDNKPTDHIINLDERELASEIERLEDTLGQLDGKLSLVNATIPIIEEE